MKKLLSQYGEYNFWANNRLIECYKANDHQLVERHIVSSFPSVKKTLLHIWDAETIWLSRLEGISRTHFPSRDFDGTIDDIFEGVLEKSKAFKYFIAEQSVDFFQQNILYSATEGYKHMQTAAEIIHHCMNHSTYHRGQLVMMARQFKLEKIPSTDLITYLRKQNKNG